LKNFIVDNRRAGKAGCDYTVSCRRPDPDQPMRSSTSRIRIIGGTWRGRLLEFRAEPGLRPTPDRVRETLFNWLQPHIAGSRCLDLFCGSGALGFEALSRGAAQLTSIDRSAAVIEQARHNLERLGGAAEFIVADSLSWLQQHACNPARYDVVFADPPFHAGLAARCIAALSASSLLAAPAHVYVECAASEPPPPTPPGWLLHRDRQAGQVAYRLYLREA
jgi:16S rRNA (guanine966-N2)-methyltransferase